MINRTSDHKFSTLHTLTILAGLILSFAFQINAQSLISVSDETKIEKEIILLGDISKISGENAEPLSRISLGYAPNIGMTREIARERIAMSIAAAGFSGEQFRLNAPAAVRVSRRGQKISKDLFRSAIEKSVADQFSAFRNVDVRIVRIENIPDLEGPAGDVKIRADMRDVANPFAPFSIPVEVRIDDRIFRRTAVNIELEGFTNVLIAARDLEVNSNITINDVRFDRRRLEKSPSNYLSDPEKLRGIRLIKNISAGSEITSDAFVSAVVVRSGDLVKIVGQSGATQISVSGEARTSGKIGDRIAVKNRQSNAVIQATVIDEGLVKVYF